MKNLWTKTKLLIGASLLTAVLGGCGNEPDPPPAAVENTANGYQVVKLFEHDGCEMFRFIDAGFYRYFAKCGKAKSVSTERTENCGKGCTRRVIETVAQHDAP